MIQKIRGALGRLEEGVLVSVLLSMVLLAVAQIIMRNFFDSSLVWADPVLRISVLWVCLLGSMIAARKNEHIAIDIASHYVPEKWNRLLLMVVGIFTATVCGIMAYQSYLFVYDEYVYKTPAFTGFPAWIAQSIIPVAFSIMSLRYVLFAINALLGNLEDKEEGEASHG